MAKLGRLLLALPILLALAACESGVRTTMARMERGHWKLPWAADDRCNVVFREGPWLGVASAYRVAWDLDYGRQTFAWNDVAWWVTYDPEGVDYKTGVLSGIWATPEDPGSDRPRNRRPGPLFGVEVRPGTTGPSNAEINASIEAIILLPADMAPDLSGDIIVGVNFDDHEGFALDKSHISDSPVWYRDSRLKPRWRISTGGHTKATGDPATDRHLSEIHFMLEPPAEYAGDTLHVRIMDRATGRIIAATEFDARGLSKVARSLREQTDAFVRNFKSMSYCF